jgi:drug/metabolite transporter (DMT)-like permease
VKHISAHYSSWFISFVRFFVGAVLVIISILATGRSFRVHNMKNWILRGATGCIAMVLFYVAIQMTSSGRATLLSDTYPVFVALFGVLFFRERIGIGQIAGLILCICGSTLVFYDGSSYPVAGSLICIGSAVASGVAVHFIKRSRESDNSFLIYLSPCIFGFMITCFSAKDAVSISSSGDAVLLILVGVFAFIGQIFLAWGFRYVPATAGSVLGMAEILFSITLSLLFLGEVMKPRFFAGGALIIAGLLVNQAGMMRRIVSRVAGRTA